MQVRMAIIPARGGSKRIPRKNIKNFCGKPIIAWSIEAALASNCFDRVIVSTDDPEIELIAKQWGAEVPFMRPASLADDYAGTNIVVRHAISVMAEQGEFPDFVCCIYATAPFIQVYDLKRGLELLIKSGSDFAFSVTSFPFPIQRAVKLTENGRVAMFFPEHVSSRSQDLEETYHDAGQFYWGRAQAFLDDIPTFSEAAVPVILPRYRVQDIDSLEDWHQAELLFQLMLCKTD